MKISREEFKEFVELYREAWEQMKEYEDILNENFLCELLFPVFDFISKSIGMYGGDDEDMIFEGLIGSCSGCFFLDENGERTTDLDVIYDRYLSDTEE